MTIHTLEKEKHNDFLQQERIDPITGDILQEGDQVVICASCKSAFLVDSWEYMDKQHCNQRITLKKIPVNEIVRIERPYLIDLDKIKIHPSINEAMLTISPYSLLAYLFCFLLDYFYNFDQFWTVLNKANMFHFSSIWIISATSSYKNMLKIKDNFLHFDKKQKNTLHIEDIKEIEIYKSKRHSIANLITGLTSANKIAYTIKITSKNELVYKLLLQRKELERISRETNLLQKFNKNSLPFLSVNEKIEKILE